MASTTPVDEPGTTTDVGSDVPSGVPHEPASAPGLGPGRGRRALARLLDVLAVLVVVGVVLAPDSLDVLGPRAFLRVPAEGIALAALALLLRGRVRTAVLTAAGLALGLLAVLHVLDYGFDYVLVRPFDPVNDWGLVGSGLEFVRSVAGRAGAAGAVLVAVLAVLATVGGLTLAVHRSGRVVTRHRRSGVAVVAALAAAWLACSLLDVRYGPDLPVAATAVTTSVRDHVVAVRDGIRDEREFARRAADDPFAGVPGDRLLTGLRGKDVVLAFVESYGRSAVEDPAIAPQVEPALADGERRLRAAGFSARSGWLTSSTAGGGSWFAHATLLSGMRSYNLATYRPLVSSDRLTLNRAFRKAGWETVGVMPGVTRAWPDGRFYGYDRLYDEARLGYRGPAFGWSPMPDQYVLSRLQRDVIDAPGRPRVMVETALTSSHAPWTPLPAAVPWDRVGDGSVYATAGRDGRRSGGLLDDRSAVRRDYATSLRYSLGTMFDWAVRSGDDDLVLVFLGDHQPLRAVTGSGASHDVPITIVAKDPQVLARVSSWGWSDGLKPGRTAPVWPMEDFRDRFLTAFG